MPGLPAAGRPDAFLHIYAECVKYAEYGTILPVINGSEPMHNDLRTFQLYLFKLYNIIKYNSKL
jgi:hypothetical protein